MKPRTLIGLVIAGVILVYLFTPIGYKVVKLRGQEARLRADVRTLVTESAALKSELQLLKTDPIYVEQVARRTFRKAKEGEVIYKFVTPEEFKRRNQIHEES